MRESTITGLGFNQDNELFVYVMPNSLSEEGSDNNNENGYIIKSGEWGKNFEWSDQLLLPEFQLQKAFSEG